MKTIFSLISMACLGFLLFTTNGWSQAIQTIKDINTGILPPRVSTEDEMLAVGSRLYIATADEISGSELWSLKVTAKFDSPESIFRRSNGDVLVADKGNHSVRRINGASRDIVTLAGSSGLSGYLNKSGLVALFNSPSAAAADTAGNIYVADTANHVIRKISPTGVVTLFAGTPNTSGFINASGATARFNAPAGLVVSGTIIYVADTGNHSIRRITSAGVVTTIAGGGGPLASGNIDGTTGTDARFNSPEGIVASGSELFIADTGNHTIRKISLTGTNAVTTLAGTAGTAGAANGTGLNASFRSPQAITLNTNNELFVADTDNHLIRRVTFAGVVTTFAGDAGTSGFVNGTGTSAKFNSPRGILADGTKLLVADTLNHVIREVSEVGVVTTYAGVPNNPGADDGSADGLASEISPTVVKDILGGVSESMPKNLTAVATAKNVTPASTTLFFTAKNSDGNRDLWKSNGTSTGTVMVKTFAGGDPPDKLTSVNGLLYFEGYDSGSGKRLLWRSDGTAAGTVLAGTNVEADALSELGNLTSAGADTLMFSAIKGSAGIPQLYRCSTRNSVTTTVALNIPLSNFEGLPWDFADFRLFGGDTLSNPRVCFAATSVPDENRPGNPVGRELFFVDATEDPSSINEPVTLNLVKDIQDGENVGSDPSQFTVSGDTINGKLFFVATTTDNGEELWSTTATLDPDNTQLILDINGNDQPSNVRNLTPMLVDTQTGVSNGIVFTANDGGIGLNKVGNELWISDGTAQGTEFLKDITSVNDGGDSNLSNFISLSPNLVLFTQTVGQASTARLVLWRTDGTESGTQIIEDFETEPGRDAEPDTAVQFRKPVVIGNTLYFMLGDDQLWKTTGASDTTTVRVHRFRAGTAGSQGQNYAVIGDGKKVVFSAFDTDHGREPWITDGTESGTSLLSDISVGTLGSGPANFTPATTSQFFFTASAEAGESELYVSDGTTASLIQKINPAKDSKVSDLFWHHRSLTLFFAASGNSGDLDNVELWKSNGVPGDAVKVKEINSLVEGASNPAEFTAIGGTVYFAATDKDLGRELFKTNGTELGTVMVKDINNQNTNDSNPEEIFVGPGGKLFFIATGFTTTVVGNPVFVGRELWTSDGTGAGTKMVKDIAEGSSHGISPGDSAYLTLVGGTMYFVANDGLKGKELWKSNGTAAGTVSVRDINTNEFEGSDPRDLINAGGRLFFTADDGVNGRELWTITSGKAVMVNTGTRTGLVTGPGDANIRDLIVVNDSLVFVADDPVTGREVWISNGTTAGTFVVADVLPGQSSSNPKQLIAFGNDLIFSASDAAVGEEPRLALLSPNISVEQPLAAALPRDGNALVDFTPTSPLLFGQNVTLPFTIRNVGITSLRNITATLSGLHAADYSITTRAASVLSGTGSSPLVVKFTPREGGERVATLTILSSDLSVPSFVIHLSGDCTKETTVTNQPVSKLVKVGDEWILPAAATTTATTPLTLQWRKNGKAMAGVTSNPLYLWPVKLADAGAYSAQFRSNTTAAGTGTSDTAQLGVVEDFSPPRVQVIRQGTPTSTTTISVNASGNGLTYQWMRSTTMPPTTPELLVNTAVDAVTKFRNVTTRTLTITGATAALDGNQFYYCIVGAAADVPSVQGGTTHLLVATSPAVIASSQNMPIGMIGRYYEHQILLANTAPENAPLTYSAKGLPNGLVLNTKTGLISGRPTKVGLFDKIKISANGVLPAQVAIPDQSVQILPMPTGLEGVYTGLVGREASLNQNLGGRIDVTVVALTGTFSGKLTLGTLSYSFKGLLDIGPPGPPTQAPPYSAKVIVLRNGILTPLTLTFTIDPTTKDRFSVGAVESKTAAGVVTAAVTAYKQTRKATPPESSAAQYLGLYNFGLKLPEQVNANPNPNLGLSTIPQGNGFGSFTVAAAGTLKLAGRLADGETFTSSVFVGPLGEVPLFFAVNSTKNKASVRGLLSIATSTIPSPLNDNVLTSTGLDWVRPANTAVISSRAPATRTYRAGFGLPGAPVITPVELEAFGGRYIPPVALLKIASPSPAAAPVANSEVKFTEGGVDVASPPPIGISPEPDVTAAVTDKNTVVVITPNPNAAKSRITPNRTTGTISGGFTLLNGNPRTVIPITPNPLSRAVSFFGLIVPDNNAGTHEGIGYFMLPQLPDDTTLITTTPILSGKMIFKKLP